MHVPPLNLPSLHPSLFALLGAMGVMTLPETRMDTFHFCLYVGKLAPQKETSEDTTITPPAGVITIHNDLIQTNMMAPSASFDCVGNGTISDHSRTSKNRLATE